MLFLKKIVFLFKSLLGSSLFRKPWSTLKQRGENLVGASLLNHGNSTELGGFKCQCFKHLGQPLATNNYLV